MSKLSSWDVQKAVVQEFCNRNGLDLLCREEEVRCGFPLKDKLGFFYSSGFDTCEIDLTEVKEENFMRESLEQISRSFFVKGQDDIKGSFKVMFDIK